MNYSKICLVNGTTCDSVTGSSFAPPMKTINNEVNQFAALRLFYQVIALVVISTVYHSN